MTEFRIARSPDDLHKAIVVYLMSMNALQSAAMITQELQVGGISDEQKFIGLLERRWWSVARIQRRVMELEAENRILQTKVHSTAPIISSRRAKTPETWLPESSAAHTLESHRSVITSVAFHPIFTVLASGSEDCSVKIWDWELGHMERTLKGHTRAVSGVDFGGRITVLASCSSDLTIKIWDPNNEYTNTRTLFGHDHSISTVRFVNPRENILASASRDASIKLWDVSTGYCVKSLHSPDESWILDVSPSVDGRWLVSGGRSQAATIWEVSTGKAMVDLLGHDNHIECCVFAPPASYPYLANLAGLKVPRSSDSAQFIATGSRDKTIKIWDSRGRSIKTLVGHDNWVRGLVFHPGGRYLISVGDDKTIRCWDLSQEARLVKTIDGVHRHFVSCIRWAPSPAIETSQRNSQARSRLPRKDSATPGFPCVFATGSSDSCVRIFK